MKRLEFNNEIIDGQSTVADNLAKSNRNFMLLKEILGSGASSQDMQNMLETISQTYVKTEDIVNNLSSSDTNKPVSALQAKNLKQDITNLTGQLQQLNQSVSSLTQSLNQNISNLTQQLNQNVSNLTQRLDNKVDKVTVYSLNQLSVQDLQNGGFEHNYETTTNKASEIGLGSGIWHIKYLKYVSAEGYGFQIALPVTGDVPKWRKAWGNEFKAWQNL